MWHVHTMDITQPLKKNEIWSFAATWMNQENILSSGISQAQKETLQVLTPLWNLY